MKQKTFTSAQKKQLLKNGANPGVDHIPVVKFFCPWGSETWLITELDPYDHNIAFGLCDLGMGCPELGSIYLPEMIAARGPFGLTVERDLHFTGEKPISIYAEEARESGRIAA